MLGTWRALFIFPFLLLSVRHLEIYQYGVAFHVLKHLEDGFDAKSKMPSGPLPLQCDFAVSGVCAWVPPAMTSSAKPCIC